jgi:hypothetical protein
MEAEKEKKALGFDVQKYLEWHWRFYEPMPQKALETFEARTKAREGGDKRQRLSKIEENDLADLAAWENGPAGSRCILENAKTPLWEVWEFEAFAGLFGEPGEVEEIARPIKLGIVAALPTLEDRKADYLKKLNGDLLHWVCVPNPLTSLVKSLDMVALFTQIQALQWIESELIKARDGESELSEKATNGLTLAQKVLALEKLGFFGLEKVKELKGYGRPGSDVFAMILGVNADNLRKTIDGLNPGHRNSPRNKKNVERVEDLLQILKPKK